ncbi:hypothetical protein [Aquabacter cavernae]|uniref:hypothetical protein n=1 Tax=Aquabacter cavernae TaxID=2496029 RepID=UPI000F8F4560|nr:hypothetical protein [Aquabacter cavernae]
MARTPKSPSAAKANTAPETAPKSPAPKSVGETNDIPQGASGTAREAPSADSGADTLQVPAGTQSAPPPNSEDQPPASLIQDVTPPPSDADAGATQELPPSVPEAADPALAIGEAGETLTAAVHPREKLRELARAGAVKDLASFEPGDELPPRLRFLDVQIDVLAWDLGPSTLVVVSTDGRKYTVDRETGEAIDTATGEVVL